MAVRVSLKAVAVVASAAVAAAAVVGIVVGHSTQQKKLKKYGYL